MCCLVNAILHHRILMITSLKGDLHYWYIVGASPGSSPLPCWSCLPEWQQIRGLWPFLVLPKLVIIIGILIISSMLRGRSRIALNPANQVASRFQHAVRWRTLETFFPQLSSTHYHTANVSLKPHVSCIMLINKSTQSRQEKVVNQYTTIIGCHCYRSPFKIPEEVGSPHTDIRNGVPHI